MFKRVLVLSPHPDDADFGAGGFIHHLLQQNVEVTWIVFSSCDESLPNGFDDGSAIKEFEEMASHHTVESIIMDFPVRQFPTHRQEILDALCEFGKMFRPDLVLCPCLGDLHQDHATIAQEAFRAFKYVSVLGYEIFWNNTCFSPNYFVPLSKQEMDGKWDMCSHYKSQLFKGKINKDVMTALATMRGSMINRPYAEAYEVIRIVK